MKISKTRFIDYVRCPRFSALDEIYREKNKAVVVFEEDVELDEIMSLENRNKIQEIKGKMYSKTDDDKLEIKDAQMEVMLPFYDEIESIAARAIKKRFSGEVIYSKDTYKQKRFSYLDDGYEFYCFLDGYQEDEKTIRIFEVKATTSLKFTSIDFKADEGDKRSIFKKSPGDIYMLLEDLNIPTNKHYDSKLKKLHRKLDPVGRYIYDLSYQRYVIDNSLTTPKSVKYYLVVLNAEYIHDGKVDENNKPIYSEDIVSFFDVTSVTEKAVSKIEKDASLVKRYISAMNANKYPLGDYCQRNDRRQCLFYPICFEEVPSLNSIFTYINGHHGFKEPSGVKHDRFELLNDGYLSATDIPFDWLNREDNQIQREVIDSKIEYVNKEKIKAGLELIKYPIYHLDFETFPAPLPRFTGEKAYAQSLFQFSIHVEKEPGVVGKDKDNFSFLASDHNDQREELIKKMLEVIKDDGGTVLVYNQSFEKKRLEELAIIYPKYKKSLENISNRVFDLMHLIKGNTKLYTSLGFSEKDAKSLNYYHEDLNGSYSIKKVLPVFSDLSYDNMNVANGTEALVTYAKFPEMNEEEHKKAYNDLLEYCKQDTWAMVLILNKLRQLTN